MSANELLKAWLPVYHAVDSGEVALRLARALAASPESSAVWLPSADRRANYVATLAYRGHLREAAGAWRPDLLWSSTLLAELALFGAYPPDSLEANFGRWLRAGDLPRSRDGLRWWAERSNLQAITRFERLADSVAGVSSDLALREEAVFAAEAARAYLALIHGDTADALQRFEQLPDSLCGGVLLRVSHAASAACRAGRSSACAQRGRAARGVSAEGGGSEPRARRRQGSGALRRAGEGHQGLPVRLGRLAARRSGTLAVSHRVTSRTSAADCGAQAMTLSHPAAAAGKL
jgi:hypothetical protein